MVLDYKEYEAAKAGEGIDKANSTSSTNKMLKPSTPKSIFQFASDQMESLHEISLEIHEKYCSPQRE
jgi:hypothetical protein